MQDWAVVVVVAVDDAKQNGKNRNRFLVDGYIITIRVMRGNYSGCHFIFGQNRQVIYLFLSHA